jgi:hypothetical protein
MDHQPRLFSDIEHAPHQRLGLGGSALRLVQRG